MNIEATVTSDKARPAIRRRMAAMTPQRLAAKVGPACARLVQERLADQPRNKRGFPSTHFWEQASDATRWEQTSEGALIRVHKIGVRQRFHGGPIRPVNTRALAYPINEESYGKTPKEFSDLFVVKTANAAFLARRGTGENARLQLMFRLTFGVDQPGNARIIPSHTEMMAAAKAAIMRGLAK